MKHLKIYTDGGARGNPGPAAIGVVIKDKNGQTIFEIGKPIGKATNNEAEYQALIFALEWLKKNAPETKEVNFYLDSLLVVSQMQGRFKLKAAHIKTLWKKAKNLEMSLGIKVSYQAIPRELNKQADSLLNKALDLLQLSNA